MSTWSLDSRLAGSTSYRGTDPKILGCQRCGGAWVDRVTLDSIVAQAQAQSINVDPLKVPRATMAMAEVVYRPCPHCMQRMNRRNFGRYSGIVLDECSTCGTYFDAGELEGVVAFVRAGGLGLAKKRDAEEAARDLAHRRQLAPTSTAMTPMRQDPRFMAGAELDLLLGFLRWVGRWIRQRTR